MSMLVSRAYQRVLAAPSNQVLRSISVSVPVFDEKEVYTNPNAQKKRGGDNKQGAQGQRSSHGQGQGQGGERQGRGGRGGGRGGGGRGGGGRGGGQRPQGQGQGQRQHGGGDGGGHGGPGMFKRLRSEVNRDGSSNTGNSNNQRRGPGGQGGRGPGGQGGNRRPNNNNNNNYQGRPSGGGGNQGRGDGGQMQRGNNNNNNYSNNRPQGGQFSGAGPRFRGSGGGQGGQNSNNNNNRKWVKGGKKGGRRDRDGFSRADYSGDNIPEAIQALLYDHDFFKANALKGKAINTRDMDGIDTFLAQAFTESSKTERSELREVIEDDSRRRTQLPRPRATTDLFQAMYDQIGNFDTGANESLGGDFAAHTNEALQRNVYYSDAEKRYMMDMASSMAVKHLQDAEAISQQAATDAEGNPESMYEGYDMIFSPKFRRGLPGIEAEKRYKAALVSLGEKVDYSQAETNWEQDAVLDEDDL